MNKGDFKVSFLHLFDLLTFGWTDCPSRLSTQMIADPMACDITSIFEKEWKWDEFYTRCECQSFNTKAKLFLPHAHVPHAHAPHAYAQDAHAPHAHIHCILCLAFISFDSIRALRLPLGSIQGDSTSQVLSGFIKFSLPFTLFQKIWKTEVNIKLQSMFLGTFVFLALFFLKFRKEWMSSINSENF